MISVKVNSVTTFEFVNDDTITLKEIIVKCLRCSQTEDPFSLSRPEHILLARLERELDEYERAIHRFKE